jgi:hypothetical protein
MEYPLTKLTGEENEENSYQCNFESSGKKKTIDLEKILGTLRKNYLLGKEVSVYTEDGYHYGILQGYDEEFVYLNNYVFDEKKLSVFDYSGKADFSKAVVPRDKVKYMSEIPTRVKQDRKKY